MAVIIPRTDAQLKAFESGHAYWACFLNTGKWLSELDAYISVEQGRERTLEWYDDLVKNGDVLRIKELYLYCPPGTLSPTGNIARLKITEPGTAFQFKGKSLNTISGRGYPTYQGIGRVENKENGDCYAFVYDYLTRTLYHGQNNVKDFKPWRRGSTPIGRFELDVIGVSLT